MGMTSQQLVTKNSPTIDIVKAYYEHRGIARPNASEALVFFMTELAELTEVLLRRDPKWTRNNSRDNSDEALKFELGDCLMMLIAAVIDIRENGKGSALSKDFEKVFEILSTVSTMALDNVDFSEEIEVDLIDLASDHGLDLKTCMVEKFRSKGMNI